MAKKRDADILASIAKGQELARKEADEQEVQDCFLQALYILAQDYQDYIVKRFCLMLNEQHHATAEEMTQDILLRMYDYMGRWNPEESVSRILHRHFRWRLRDFLKTLKREVRDHDIYNSEREQAGPESKPEQTDLLKRAINKLSPSQRDFLFKCYREDKTLEEVAEDYGIALDSVRKKLERIEAKLESLMESLERESDATEKTRPR